MHSPRVILSLLSQIITPPIPPESLEAQAAQKAAQCVQAWRDWDQRSFAQYSVSD